MAVKKSIAVIGGGAWGRALAYTFSQKNDVFISSRKNQSFLKSYFSHKVTQISQDDALNADFIIIAIKSEVMREWLKSVKINKNAIILVATKGIEVESGAFISEIFEQLCENKKIGYLMGPSFAKEVLEGMPCALNIHTRETNSIKEIAEIFPDYIKTYFNNDVIGGEVAGAYKNIIAIAGGISDGLNLGNNAKASMMARGLIEMARFGRYFGAIDSTFLGLSGAGDLFLSANSILSRNYRVGLGLANGEKLANILYALGEVAEGVLSTRAVVNLANKYNIYVPIARQVYEILEGKSPQKSVKELLAKDF